MSLAADVRDTISRPSLLAGRSAAIQAVNTALVRIASHAHVAVIVGESGVGKSHLAALLHRVGPLRHLDLAWLRCGASLESTGLPEALASAREGAFCVEEVADLPPRLQSQLVGALDTGSPHLGPPATPRFQLIATSSVGLRAEVEAGRFRADLYYRLSAFQLVLPPLRERREDIDDLVKGFIRDAAQQLGRPVPALTRGARAAFLSRAWPGNVRELRSVVERAVLYAEGSALGERDVRWAWAQEPTTAAPPAIRDSVAESLTRLAAAERARVETALVAARGNKSRAAQDLGISRRALYRLLARLERL